MAQVAPIAMRDAAHTILEVTPEEEALLEENSAYWTKGNTLMYLDKLKDGQADYADLSYMLPYEFMLAPARAALQVYGEKGEVGANEAEQIFAGTWEGFKKFAEPFASEGLAAERVIDVTIRDGKTQTGAEIYEPGEMMGDKLSKSLVHVTGAFMPGIIDQFTTIKGGQFVPGRATRAVTDMPSRDGDPYTIAEEAGTMLIGVRPMKLKVDRSLGYAGGEYSANRSSAVQIFTKVADDNDADVNDILEAYAQANEARRRHQAELRDKMLKAQAAGMSVSEITQAFKGTGVSSREVRDILNNRYTPIKVSRDLIREVSNEVNVKRENRILRRVPVGEINKLRQTFMNTPITGDTKPATEERVAPVSSGLFDDLLQQNVTPEAPATTSSGIFDDLLQQPAPSPQPTTPQQVRDKTRTILGTASNPISALKRLRNLSEYERLILYLNPDALASEHSNQFVSHSSVSWTKSSSIDSTDRSIAHPIKSIKASICIGCICLSPSGLHIRIYHSISPQLSLSSSSTLEGTFKTSDSPFSIMSLMHRAWSSPSTEKHNSS